MQIYMHYNNIFKRSLKEGHSLKATGIVRRIDDLGRVVIPKEIRRTLRIREGDPLEIFTDRDGEIILKKYSPIGELSEFAKQYTEALSQATGHITFIADKDQIIAIAGGSKKDYLEKKLSPELEKAIQERNHILVNGKEGNYLPITNEEGDRSFHSQLIYPIISEGDSIGAVIFASKDEAASMGEVELKVAQSASSFLGRQMEQ